MPSDETTAALRAESIEVLAWGASIFRPGGQAHAELAGLAERLRDPDVRFRPTGSHADSTVRGHLEGMRRSAEALAAALREAPEGAYPFDAIPAAEAAAAAARGALDAMAAEVSFGQVAGALGGTWGDDDLSKAIEGLRRRLERALEEPEAAAAPAP